MPEGAICRCVLATSASGGSGGPLEIGPTMTRRLNAVCDEAGAVGSDDARLTAAERLRSTLDRLRMSLDHPDAHP